MSPRPRGRSGLPRREARRLALDLLFEADLRDRPLDAGLAERLAAAQPLDDFAVALVRGVAAERETLDALIRQHARGWALERMPTVDRNLLRLALHELRAGTVPLAVVIDEAVELAKSLSTDDSPRFINGVLAAAVRADGAVAGEPGEEAAEGDGQAATLDAAEAGQRRDGDAADRAQPGEQGDGEPADRAEDERQRDEGAADRAGPGRA